MEIPERVINVRVYAAEGSLLESHCLTPCVQDIPTPCQPLSRLSSAVVSTVLVYGCACDQVIPLFFNGPK